MCKGNHGQREDTALLTQGLQYPHDHHPALVRGKEGGHKQLRLWPKQKQI